MLGNRTNPIPPPSYGRRLPAILATLLACGAAALAALAVAAPSAPSATSAATVADGPKSRCATPDGTPLTIFHGGRLKFVIVANAGVPAVSETALAVGQPAQTADYKLTKLAVADWSFQSLRVDKPNRTVLHRVRIQVSFSDGSQEVVNCDVNVVHRIVSAGANCVPKSLPLLHGKGGVFTIVPIPGSAPIFSTGLASSQPATTPNYRIQKLPGNRFSFLSKKVHPIGRTEVYIIRIRVRYGQARDIVASLTTKCVAVVTHPALVRQFAVQVKTSYDHEPDPRSDVCVDIATSPTQPGAQASVRMLGPTEQQAALGQEQNVILDSRGAGRARFLVYAIGTYQIAVAVVSTSGETSTAELTINNASPSGSCGP